MQKQVSDNSRTIIVAGDLAPLGRPEKLLAGGEAGKVFGSILPAIKGVDCFFANLECPLTGSLKNSAKLVPI